MPNRLIVAGMLTVVELLIAFLARKAYRERRVTISFGDSPSRGNLFDITIRQESHPILFGIAMLWILAFLVGFPIAIVLVLRGWS